MNSSIVRVEWPTVRIRRVCGVLFESAPRLEWTFQVSAFWMERELRAIVSGGPFRWLAFGTLKADEFQIPQNLPEFRKAHSFRSPEQSENLSKSIGDADCSCIALLCACCA